MSVAFFDLDRTLLSVNSAWLWVKRELRLGYVKRRHVAEAAVWMGTYQLGFSSLDSAVRRIISTLSGVDVKTIRDRTTRFYEEELKGLYRPGAHEALARHRERGDRLVLLTSSSSYLAELVASDLKLDAILCNRFEVDAKGIHTGRSMGVVCFGEGKLHHALDYSKLTSVPLQQATFYTDSYADLSVLTAVGRAVVVNPDPRLRREARRRGWPVVDWGVPMQPSRSSTQLK